MDINEALSLRMKELAKERHISVNEIIKRGGINQSTISEIMSGRSKHPRVSTIQKFCTGCGISMGEFFSSEYFSYNQLDLLEENENKKRSLSESKNTDSEQD
ncbi:MAG: helix-turn-helix domain-containing protein [Bacillaceae bacterium]